MTNEEADALARRVADTMLSKEGTGPAWGLVIEEAREGYARVRMKLIRPDMANGHGIAHGGMIFALADTCLRLCLQQPQRDGRSAANASIAFLSPAKVGETLVAEARGTRPSRAAAAFMRCGLQLMTAGPSPSSRACRATIGGRHRRYR